MSNRAESFLVGLVGDGVMPSLTPYMHEREGDVQGLRYLYRPIDLLELELPGEAVGELLSGARRLGYNGLNITHPCKQLVLEHLDEISPDARRLGAVNTVTIRDGRFIGHNTDFSGFAAALASGLPGAKLGRVVQLGAGGAGSAVAYALLTAGVRELVLVDTDAGRCAARAAELAGFFPDQSVTARTTAELPRLMPQADGLVHCTPVGMAAHPGVPLDMSLLEPRHWVADIVYRPIETELVRGARAKGCEVLDGGRMAVGQAADAFRIFTGLEPDADRMRAHFLELVAAEEVAA
ncbi:shikimate dehydrogenase [Arthrobacter sp. V4I6]|uniref:shikimate dehydrogenase n=1 Tax=unclassified Arthrobacter TaxID=235627 RepID=UPI00278AEF86|nr:MULTISPECIES: shikimate dehydrogenase [unclassified Arthrobacter]MDQ0823508.1 shikimate dehydrogenase [Arthrobacter sp. V1I7]MDQ0853143.1 shikimate dehydrogenase [Arthrobacter sp. V4I6]